MIGTFEDFLLCEAYQVRVNAKGVKTKRKKCPPGYKLSSDGSHCVRIGAAEHLRRAKGAKRGNKKMKSKRSLINRNRDKAMKKRHSMGL